jgi:hypothetical protein
MAGASERSNTPLVVLVAIVGLLSTVGAAALGGYFADRSVQRQLEAQRSAEIQDQRREVYVAYLRATTQACDAYMTDDEATFDKAAVEVLNQHGHVQLMAGPDLHDAVQRFTDAIISAEACGSNEAYFAFRDAFLHAAEPDLE